MSSTPASSYQIVEGWEQLPAGFVHGDVADVAVDSHDRVYLLTRHDARVMVYESTGQFVTSWGEDFFTARPHGITIGTDDTVYVVDEDDQTVRRFTTSGSPKGTPLGIRGTPSDTGVDSSIRDLHDRVASIKRGAAPFNHPTKVAIGPHGDLFVSDGYGNSRVHHFSPDGELMHSWGSPGQGPGEFHLPHSLAITNDERVFVADRENDRIQIFDTSGKYLDEWRDTHAPAALVVGRDGLIYVAENQWLVGDRRFIHGTVTTYQPARVTVFDPSGVIVARWGEDPPCAPGNLLRPHGICVDSNGAIYVTEANLTGAGERHCHTVQKFTPKYSHGVE